MWIKAGLLALALLGAGCQFGSPPNPNDPSAVPQEAAATVMRKNLAEAAARFNERRAKGELSEKRYREMIKEQAAEMIDRTPLKKVEDQVAWEYAEVLITAERWEEAKPILEQAVKSAKREHRRVNDSLRLARVQAELGEVDEAIRTTRSVFDTRRRDAGPILPSVIFEVLPAAEGKAKGKEVELAKLVVDSIAQHERVIVDPESEAGRAFLIARPVHVRNAWRRAAYFYQLAGQQDRALECARKADAAEASQSRI